MNIPILAVDFDGVLHGYQSGWKGPRCIPDPPVPGAIDWLRSLLTDADCRCALAPRFLSFDVQIYSSRSRYWGGRRAMKKWIGERFEEAGHYAQLVELLKFPLMKPPAFLHIDDRAMTFKGVFPTEEVMLKFTPWNKQKPIETCQDVEVSISRLTEICERKYPVCIHWIE